MSGSELFFKLFHSHVVDSDDSSYSSYSSYSSDSSDSSESDEYNPFNLGLNQKPFDFSKAVIIGSDEITLVKPKIKKTLKTSQPKQPLIFKQQNINFPKPTVVHSDIPPQDPRAPGEDDQMYNKRVELYNKIASTKFGKYANTYSIAMVNKIMKQVNYTPDVELAMKQVADEIGILDWETK